MKRAVLAAVTSALLAGGGSVAEADRGDPEIQFFELEDGNEMATYLYGSSETRPLVILVHGASDTHEVFDFAPGYSLARDLARRGYGVLAVDRIGYGASSRPNGDSLNFATQAAQLQEIVESARAGALGFDPPAVLMGGPSLGADLTLVTEGTYGDLDGIIVATHTNALQPDLFEVDVGAWLGQGDYFDFGAEFRRDFFYAEPFAPEWIIEEDNATRSLVPRGEILDALNNASAPYRANIEVPVLLLQAELDGLFIPQDDSALFTSSEDVSFELLKHAGHKAFSHPTSKDAAASTIADWLATRF